VTAPGDHRVLSIADFRIAYFVTLNGVAVAKTDVTDFTVSTAACVPLSVTRDEVVTDVSTLSDGTTAALGTAVVPYGPLGVDASASDVRDMLVQLPQVEDGVRVLASAEREYVEHSMTVTYEGNDGDVPQLTCWQGEVKCADYRTVVGGATLGGFFVLGASPHIPFGATAAEMEAALSPLATGEVEVSMPTALTARGEAEWLVTFVGGEGAVPLLGAVSSLTGGDDAAVAVALVTEGNFLGGTFSLSLGGHRTGAVNYDASAAAVKEALELLPTVTTVDVSRVHDFEASTEGGLSWEVTFISAASVEGDVESLVPHTDELTGIGAGLLVVETEKGAEASGSRVKLSWASPPACSATQGNGCGAPVALHLLERSTAFDLSGGITEQSVLSETPAVQIVTASAGSTMGGYFRVGLEGGVSAAIPHDASATEVRDAIEGVLSDGSAAVKRTFAAGDASDAPLSLAFGDNAVTCDDSGSQCAAWAGGYAACDLVSVEEVWFRVHTDGPAGDSLTLPLGQADDCAIRDTHLGAATVAAKVAPWAFGYQWTVEFLSGEPVWLTSPAHALSPVGAGVAVRGLDCVGCAYVDDLEIGTDYFMRLHSMNDLGSGATTSILSIMPNRVPFSPERAAIEVLSGTELEVFFCPPSINAGDIVSFEIEYSTSVSFATSETAVYNVGPLVVCPYAHVITGLTAGTVYFVRVRALNDVLVQDNVAWSATLQAETVDQPPYPPSEVRLRSLSATALQVMVEPPVRDGGQPVTSFTIEIDTVPTFAGAGLTSAVVNLASLPKLGDGAFVYTHSGLEVGESYYVRAAATTSVDTSTWAQALDHPVVTSEPADAPGGVALQVVPSRGVCEAEADDPLCSSEDDGPATSLLLEWEAPESGGGSAISGYRVAFWEADTTLKEVQAVDIEWAVGAPPASSETWTLFYKGVSTVGLQGDAKASAVRDALRNLYDSGSPVVDGDVTVVRTALASGNRYSITFEDVTSGDRPPLVVKTSGFAATTSVGAVRELVDGARAGGMPEVQVVSTSGTGAASQLGSEVVGGFFRLAFSGSEYSAYIPAAAHPSSVEDALRQLPEIGAVTVTRSAGSSQGYDWQVTFEDLQGDRGAIVADGSLLVTANDDAAISVQDGDNAVSEADGAVVCDDCVSGELPGAYRYVDVGPDIREYSLTGLVTGVGIKASVSARNAHGSGTPAVTATATAPPLSVPGAPDNVAINVGSASDSLIVDWTVPVSDGGAKMSSFLVQLSPSTVGDAADPTATFEDIVETTVQCGTVSAVWRVVSGGPGESKGVADDFTLQLSRALTTVSTDPIPFNAVATAAEEVGDAVPSDSLVHCELAGSGGSCDSTRIPLSGSMESKIRALANIGTDTVVSVSRSETALSITWDITFIGGGDDYDLQLVASNIDYTGVAAGNVVVSKARAGATFEACVAGTAMSTEVAGLVNGQLYWSRVIAANDVGYSAAEASLQPAKPIAAPGRPSGVTLSPEGADSLRVAFSPPASDGGDAVSSYLIEYATEATFAAPQTSLVALLTGGAPYHRTLTGLVQGDDCYVRVYANNALGAGEPQPSTPQFLHPYVEPSAPTHVRLAATSDVSITVAWEPPADTGGDPISSYVVEIDTTPTFNGMESAPHKLAKTVSGNERGATFDSLEAHRRYYARARAVNAAGGGPSRASSPANVRPAQRVPGKPVALVGVSGSSGDLDVQFRPPLVPAHGMPCSGTEAAPELCPGAGGGGGADGGAAITYYYLEWSLSSRFESEKCVRADRCQVRVSAGAHPVTALLSAGASGLLSGKVYFVRVCAENSLGRGPWGVAEGGVVVS
jgi:hypothetical protein